MKRYSREYTLSGQFRFRGRMPQSQVKELQNFAALVVAPSLRVALLRSPVRTH